MTLKKRCMANKGKLVAIATLLVGFLLLAGYVDDAQKNANQGEALYRPDKHYQAVTFREIAKQPNLFEGRYVFVTARLAQRYRAISGVNYQHFTYALFSPSDFERMSIEFTAVLPTGGAAAEKFASEKNRDGTKNIEGRVKYSERDGYYLEIHREVFGDPIRKYATPIIRYAPISKK